MQRQKSILSFFQKPLHPPSQNSTSSCHVPANQQLKNGVVQSQPAGSDGGAVLDPSLQVRGTDTPPEKVPRQVLPAGFAAAKEDIAGGGGGGGSSLFSSIMHKFVRVENAEKLLDKNQGNSTSPNACFKELPSKQGIAPLLPEKDNAFCFQSEDDVPKPETPGMRPLVPRLKRIREDSLKFEDKYEDNTQSDASKRGKFVKDMTADPGKISNVGISDGSASKFEWLDPSLIKDANGRRPNDPLYDRKTLYIPHDALKKMSASQKQYWTVKSQYMDVILFFKVGKFYELYELDAEIGHKELDWKITLSGVGKCRQVGISESGIDDAVEKLVARGYKVGRIEQLETSDQAKARGGSSVIPRKLVQVVTPATVTDGNIGPDAVNLLAIKEETHGLDRDGKTVYGFAFVDCAALQFWVGSINDDASSAALGALLMQVSPKEVIYESRGLSKEAQKALRKYSGTGTTALEASATNFVNASEIRSVIQLKGYFSGSSNPWNDALNGVMHHDACLCALGGLVSHLSRMMSDDVLRNGNVLPYQVHKGCLRMDGQTLVNLEIFSNNADGGSSGTLLSYLDNCMTSSGKRLLRKWICHPLKCIEGINNRLNVVECLMAHGEIISVTAQYLRKIPDLERMLGRVKASCQASAPILLPFIGKKTLRQRVKVFGSLVKGLRIAMDMLLLLEKEEQIHSLLLQIFSLPDLNGCDGLDKFLIQFEAAVASEFPNYQNHDVTDSEAETLSVLIELFIEKANQWLQVIHGVNCIDVLRSFAIIASMSSGVMSRPVILHQLKTTTFSQKNSGPVLNIKGLWHPFALGVNGELPVPNDLYLGDDSDEYHPHTLLLTGPNMGGKSTLLRAACLAVLLAQLGCFVPSQKCVLSIVDVIFTRLGATDRIMTGESTFFVECTETASVLQNATQDSLVILDELGRGTSTFDGYAIAYAVFRHLVEKVNCRLLFATHYHPLTKEFASHPNVKLQHMACAFKPKSENYSEGAQDLVFLYRLTSGACPESYGLQVATMAGVPEKVVEAASQAAQVMKKSVGQSFKSSEQRSEFSTLHEDWLKTLLNVARTGVDTSDDDNDLYDTLFCLWHELKSSCRPS